MTDKDIKTIELVINGEQAKKQLNEINSKLEIARQKKQAAFEKGDAKGLAVYTREINKLETQARKMETRAVTITRTLNNLDKATPKELNRTIKEINRELNSGNVKRGSQEWNTMTLAMRKAKEELRQINEGSKKTKDTLLDKVALFGNKWVGFVTTLTQGYQVITGLTATVNQATKAYADMEEAMANVMKFTGMTKQQVVELNEALKKMDSRTPREKLNALAGDAGRLGITTKEAVLEFVDGADKINVALGDDLGDDAVKNIGKLAMAFGEDKTKGLRGAMLATGSAVNELSQNSSADAGYLVEFTARLAGAGKQAKISQANLLGLGAVLDENMLKEEMSATALSNLITKLYQDPARFANIAGLKVKEFTNLLKTDANAALLQFVGALSKQGGMDKLAPMFESMKLDGSRAVQVIASLATNIDKIRERQMLANQAYDQGTSVIKEYNTMNNTVQAKLDKRIKQFNDLRIQLGQQLLPIVEHGLHLTSTVMRLISSVISWTSRHLALLAQLIVVVTSYKIALGAMYLWEKRLLVITAAEMVVDKGVLVLTKAKTAATLLLAYAKLILAGNIKKANAAMRLFQMTMKINPYALLITALTAIAVVLYRVMTRTKSLTAEQQGLRNAINDVADATKQANEQTVEQKSRISALRTILEDSNQKYRDRKAALDELKKIVPDYHANLSKEGELVNNNSSAIDRYIKELDRMALAEALKEKMVENLKKQIDAETAVDAWNRAVNFRNARMNQAGHQSDQRATVRFNGPGLGSVETYEANSVRVQDERLLKTDKERLAVHQKTLTSLKSEGDALKSLAKKKGILADVTKLQAGVSGQSNDTAVADDAGGGSTGKGGSKNGKTGKKTDPVKEATDRIKKQTDAERVQWELRYQTGLIDRRTYEDALLDVEDNGLAAEQKLYKVGSNEWQALQAKRYEGQQKQQEQWNDWSMKDLDSQEQTEQNAARSRYADGLMDEKDYQAELDRIKLEYLKRRAQFLHGVGSEEEAQKYDSQIQQIYQDEQIEKRKEFVQKWQELQKKLFPLAEIETNYRNDLSLLDEAHAKGLVKEGEYQKKRKELKDKYDEDMRDKSKDAASLLGMPADEISSSFITLMQQMESLRAKQKEGAAGWQDYASMAVAAFSMVGSIAGSAANYFNAVQNAESQAVSDRYDAEIEKAGSSTVKGKQLETKKQKELAAIKTKYNKKAMALEIAQAVASTATAAINAYASASKINWVLGPIAAAMATAAGMIQIATIKKQHEAQSSGYYSGGFTGGSDYRREAGVVHQGEFVVNHDAVRNPNVLPMLQRLDYAQRNNTVGSLTAQDVSRVVTAPQQTASYNARMAGQPAVVVDNSENAQAIRRLNEKLDEGIAATVVIEGPNGFEKQYSRYKKMKSRA